MNRRAFELLLSCARSRPYAGRIRTLVKAGVDWRTLLDLAQYHGVRPLLRQSLRSVCWDDVPRATQLELECFNKAIVQKNLLYAGELLRLLGVFQQNAIAIATFKGAVLAEAVYGDVSHREFGDLDVIVQKSDAGRAEDILTACGYQAVFPDRNFRSAFMRYHGQYTFRHSQTGVSVDLHWRLSGPSLAFPLQAAEFWSRLEWATILGRTVPTFTLDDLTLFLAAHGTKERWRCLKLVCDFAELLHKHPDINWGTVLDQAKKSHCLRSLLLAVLLASALLDAPAPEELVDKARESSAVRALAEQAQLRMLSTAEDGDLDVLVSGLYTHDLFWHRIWPAVAYLTTRTVGDYQAMPLHKSLWGIYYLTRPFRLAGKAAKLMSRKNS
jgi:hypothetical protein